MKTFDPLNGIGQAVMGFTVLVLVCGLMALYLVYLALEWLQDRRILGLIALWAAICIGLFYSTGCATAPATPTNDPEIWRPKNPVYPLPQ